jgi:hypothetical protein
MARPLGNRHRLDNGPRHSCGAKANSSRQQPQKPIPMTTFALLAVGALGLLAYAWRRRKQTSV